MSDACIFHIKEKIYFLFCLPVIVHTNIVLHQPLCGTVDINDRNFFNSELFNVPLFQGSFIIQTTISWAMSKENL